MSRTQLHPLQLNSLPRTHEHDEYTARPGGNRSTLSWTTNQDDSRPPSPIIDPTPGLPLGLSRPLAPSEQERLAHLDRLKFFLATAPSRWDTSNANASSSSSDPYLNMGMGMNAAHHPPAHPALNRFLLPNQEYVTCVLWNGLYHITGTDIVRALVFRFEAFGRPVRNMKKFEEGVFSDLRNLKPGQDATLEEPKSPFLDLLFKYQCIRTQKKQKVFYWFSVPHDRLFLDALERDLKREKIGHESTTQVVGEPAQSFVYDGAFKRSLYEQFVKAAGGKDGESDLERVVRGLDENGINGTPEDMQNGEISDADNEVSGDEASLVSEAEASKASKAKGVGAPAANNPNSPFFNMFSLFEGSPTYKQRRKKTTRPSALSSTALASTTSAQHGVMADEMDPNDVRYDRYTYPTAGDQYPSYSGNTAYGYHPNSSPPGTNHFPHMRNGYGQEVGYGQAYQVNGLSDTSTVRVKEEPVSAADMFLRQARGELVNAAGPTPAEIRAKRHSYAGTGIDTTSVPVWLEGRFAGVGMAATSAAPPPPFAGRGRSLDDSMGTSSPYIQPQSNLPSTAGPYPSGSPPTGPSPPASEHSPQAASDSPPGTAEAAVYPNTVAVPGTSSSGAPTTFKAFACPLLSCGRFFKRMEHLKRHLRTHTLERPFACTNEGCGKRFSRSDNLGQHSRVCRGGKSDTSDSDVEGVERPSEGSSLGLTGMGTEWGVNVGEWINSEMDEEAAIDASGKEDGSKGDSEMEGPSSNISVPLNMFGGANGMGMGMGMNSGVSGNAYSAPLDVPMEMCEVELTGDVREVHGDEEGLVRVHVRSDSSDEGYITGESGHYTSEPQQNVENYNQQSSRQFFNSGSYMNHPPQHHSSLDSHLHAPHSHHVRAPSPGHSLDSRLDAQSQWAMRGTPSPAFSTISVPAFTPNNRNSWAGGSPSRPQSSYMRQSSGGSSNDNTYGADDSSVPYHSHIQSMNQISVSAPSHKLSFDHSSLYPPGLLDPSSASFAGSMGGLSVDSSTGGGPVRRHRSMTPSLMRTDGGVVRKPTSGGSPGEGVVTNGYHPYASSSRASSLSRGGGSVHSSPAGLPIPLPGMGMQRSESRASNLSVEVAGAEHLQHARQMLSRPGSADPSAAMNYQGEMMYRTDSPASFPNHLPPANGQVTDSPGTFTIDLPSSSYQQSSHLHHSATVPAPSHYGMDDHFGVHSMNGGNYYPHHVSTM